MQNNDQCIMCASPATRSARVCLEEPAKCKGSWSVSLDKRILLCDTHSKSIMPYLILNSQRLEHGI